MRGPTAHTAGQRAAPSPRRIKWDILAISAYGLIWVSIGRVHEVFPILAKVHPGIILNALGGIALVTTQGALKFKWGTRWPTMLLLGLTASILGSIAFGISQGGAYYQFMNYASKTLICAFFVIVAIRTPQDLWLLAWAYVMGAMAIVVLSLIVFRSSGGSEGISRLAPNFSWDANDTALVLMVAVPLTALLYLTSGKTGKMIAGFGMFGLAASIAKTGSRGGFLALGAVLVAFLFSLKGTSVARRLGIVALLATGLAIAAPEGYWAQMNTIVNPEADYNWDSRGGRRQLWIRGLGYMAEYPVFGLGVGNFGRAEGTISTIAQNFTADQAGIKWAPAHNSFVQAAAELGIPGGLMFAWLALGTIVLPWRLRRRIPPDWANGDWDQRFLLHAASYLPLAGVAFVVGGFFVSFAFNEPVYILAGYTGGLLMCVERRMAVAPAAAALPSTPLRGYGVRRLPLPQRRPIPQARPLAVNSAVPGRIDSASS
jgi:O-antigen ligase